MLSILAGLLMLALSRSSPATDIVARPAPEWNAKFAGKDGWIGGDGVASVVLGPDRVLWLFGDTLLGTVKEGRRVETVMVNNTVAVQTGKNAALRFVAGKKPDGKPAAFFRPAEDMTWFWPQSAIRVGNHLFVFLPQIKRAKAGGPFGFQQVGQWLAVVENPDDAPESWRVKQHQVPFAVFGPDGERSWGSAVLREGESLYVYGYAEKEKRIGKRQLLVARVPGERLTDFGAWRFWTAKGWGKRAEDAIPLADGLATEFSVSPVPGGKGFVVVYTENGLGDRIVGRCAAQPTGPWSAPMLLYQCPEMSKDKGVFSYAAKVHAWAVADEAMLLSYCVNAWQFARLFQDAEVYRPKFVRVKWIPSK